MTTPLNYDDDHLTWISFIIPCKIVTRDTFPRLRFEKYEEVVEWSEEFIEGEWSCCLIFDTFTRYHIKDPSDAVLFKLRWSDLIENYE